MAEEITKYFKLDLPERRMLAKLYIDKWGEELLGQEVWGDSYREHGLEELEGSILGQLNARSDNFNEGQIVSLEGSRPVGLVNSIVRQINSPDDFITRPELRTYKEFTGDYTFSSHEPSGNTICCPSVISSVKGGMRRLIAEARSFAVSRGIENMLVYTRPSRYSESGIGFDEYLKSPVEGDPIAIHLKLRREFAAECGVNPDSLLPPIPIIGGRPYDRTAGGNNAVVYYPSPKLAKISHIQSKSEQSATRAVC